MKPCERPPVPDILVLHGARWTQEYVERRRSRPGCRFVWRSHNGEPVNRLLQTLLAAMTQDHCAYCDGYPLDVVSHATIDHFRPKSRYPEEVYSWTNLYYCCEACQGFKLSSHDELLLRPDAPEYAFEHFFTYNYKTGDIGPNPGAEQHDRRRAETTIEILGLNRGGRPQARRRALAMLRTYLEGKRDRGLWPEIAADFPYRFLVCPDGIASPQRLGP